MPGWVQVFANHQPVTVTVDAARNLVLGQAIGWSVVSSIAWSLGLIAVFWAPRRASLSPGFLSPAKLPEGRSRWRGGDRDRPSLGPAPA